MQHIYCTECGSKVSYSGAKPKFCSSCGTPIGGATVSKPTARAAVRPAAKTERPLESVPLKDDETDINYVPNIGELSYDVAHEGSGNKTYKFGDVVNVESEQSPEK